MTSIIRRSHQPGDDENLHLKGNLRGNEMSRCQDNTESSTTTTTKSPEQVSVLASVGCAELSVRSDNLELENAVYTQTKRRGECAVSRALKCKDGFVMYQLGEKSAVLP